MVSLKEGGRVAPACERGGDQKDADGTNDSNKELYHGTAQASYHTSTMVLPKLATTPRGAR